MSAFAPFVSKTVLTASALNAALGAVEAEALAGVQAARAAADAAASTAADARSTAETVLAAATSGTAGTRPALTSLTDVVTASGTAAWTDDGTSYVFSGSPVQTTSSSAAAVSYAGKAVPAYGPTGVRTLTARVSSLLPDADGLKVGIALRDPVAGCLYVVAVGADYDGIPANASAYYRPYGPLVQQVSGLSASGSTAGTGTRQASAVFSLPQSADLWLRLTDTRGSGISGAFSRDGVLWSPIPFQVSTASQAVGAGSTWGVLVDVGLNQRADWSGALGAPEVLCARVLSLVEATS